MIDFIEKVAGYDKNAKYTKELISNAVAKEMMTKEAEEVEQQEKWNPSIFKNSRIEFM